MIRVTVSVYWRKKSKGKWLKFDLLTVFYSVESLLQTTCPPSVRSVSAAVSRSPVTTEAGSHSIRCWRSNCGTNRTETSALPSTSRIRMTTRCRRLATSSRPIAPRQVKQTVSVWALRFSFILTLLLSPSSKNTVRMCSVVLGFRVYHKQILDHSPVIHVTWNLEVRIRITFLLDGSFRNR